MTGAVKNTVLKLLVDAGRTCAEYQHNVMRNLICKRLQIDEIWSFVGMKQKNVPDKRRDEYGIGEVWTFVAIDAETKSFPSWLVGLRDSCHATAFVEDLASRLTHRVQITTDGHRMYLDAMEAGFGGQVHFAQLVKQYSNAGQPENPETRYSPGECCGTTKNIVTGTPDEAHVSTSHIKRQNLTMRMRTRRFTRLTNAFSKELANHEYAVALHFYHYNFIRRHQTLWMPPALKARKADHL